MSAARDGEHDTQTSVAIRPANADDAPFIRQLASRFDEAGTPPWRDAAKMRAFHAGGIEQAVEQLLTPQEGHTLFIATDAHDRPLGFVHLHGERSVLTGEEQGYVAMLAVMTEAEGRGIGRALLAAGEVWARAQGFQHLALDTFGANERARTLYGHLGFVEETLKLVKPL